MMKLFYTSPGRLVYKPVPGPITHVGLAKTRHRFFSIDILRGAVMLIMTLDHARHFLHLPAMADEPTNLATTTPVLFFTRWITHFCAPAFLFLSGVSAFISGQKKTKRQLSIFLIKRGSWLVLVELVIVSFSWSFDPLYHKFFLQVIWAIGWSMILLGLLVRTSIVIIASVGLVLFFGHNILDYVSLRQQGPVAVLWKLLLTSRVDLFFLNSSKSVSLIYTILPWTAIMLFGFVAGNLYKKEFDDANRRQLLLWAGTGLVILFIALRFINQYGDPVPWSAQKNEIFTFLSFINVTKYPVSLQYSCMTLGPVLIILALLKDRQNGFTNFLAVFGKVPFFYYLLHFFLIHIICGVLFFASGHAWNETNDPASFVFFRPSWFGVSLGMVFLAWVAVIFILYFPCRWFAKYKTRNKQWWLSYI